MFGVALFLIGSQADAGIITFLNSGDNDTINGARFYQFTARSSGTGVIDSFVRYQRASTTVTSGYRAIAHSG